MRPMRKKPISFLRKVLYGVLALLACFILLGVYLNMTGWVPKTVDQMLLFVSKRSKSIPESSLDYYNKFGAEGEEALIRIFFRMGNPGQHPYLEGKVREEFSIQDATPFVEQLSRNKDFLLRILAIAKTDPSDAENSPYRWVLEHDRQLFMKTLRELDPGNENVWSAGPDGAGRLSREYEAMWEAWLGLEPEKAQQAMLALFVERISDPRLEERLVAWGSDFMRQSKAAGPEYQGLPADRAFLRSVLAFTDQNNDGGPALNKVAAWVLEHDDGAYREWLDELPVSDPRLAGAWDLYIERKGGEGFDAFLAMLTLQPGERHMPEADFRNLKKACEAVGQKHSGFVTPDRLRTIFLNRLDRKFVWDWKLDPKDWLLRHPDELGLALWHDMENEWALNVHIPWDALAGRPVTPTVPGNKVLILFKGGAGKASLDMDRMRGLLTPETAADSLYSYDRRIEVSLTAEVLFRYYEKTDGRVRSTEIEGVREDLTVALVDPRTGKTLAKKKFTGQDPPKESLKGKSYMGKISGWRPDREADAYIRELLAR